MMADLRRTYATRAVPGVHLVTKYAETCVIPYPNRITVDGETASWCWDPGSGPFRETLYFGPLRSCDRYGGLKRVKGWYRLERLDGANQDIRLARTKRLRFALT